MLVMRAASSQALLLSSHVGRVSLRNIALIIVLCATFSLAISTPSVAVFSGDMSPRARSGDADYADGIEAWDAKRWPDVVEAMQKVVARRPHHDNAWTRLGFALRKLGRFEESLEAYTKAITLNPHHREALEYMGEAYLMLDRLGDARDVLARLDGECRRVALVFTDGDFRNGCGEYKELKSKIDAYVASGKLPDRW